MRPSGQEVRNRDPADDDAIDEDRDVLPRAEHLAMIIAGTLGPRVDLDLTVNQVDDPVRLEYRPVRKPLACRSGRAAYWSRRPR